MNNSEYLEMFNGARGKCDKCGSEDLLLFVESRIKDCVAWACYSCRNFEIRGKKNIEEFFKSKHEQNQIP